MKKQLKDFKNEARWIIVKIIRANPGRTKAEYRKMLKFADHAPRDCPYKIWGGEVDRVLGSSGVLAEMGRLRAWNKNAESWK